MILEPARENVSTACFTCQGSGTLRARYGALERGTPCPPCGGKGEGRNASTHWGAGPVSKWAEIPS